MKKHLTITIILFCSLTSFAQQTDWDELAKTDIRLLPKYGHAQKTEEQKIADEEFIKTTMQTAEKHTHLKGDRTAVSNNMVKLGFDYFHRGDLITAMFRFNQAYLLDTANPEIYWGYGAIYMSLGKYEQAQKQYQEGLSLQPDNTHLLTDYGTYFLVQYYESIDEENSTANLDAAIVFLSKSHQLDNKDQITLFKLSFCHWLKGECTNAWKFYDECEKLGGELITEEYTKDLEEKCPRIWNNTSGSELEQIM